MGKHSAGTLVRKAQFTAPLAMVPNKNGGSSRPIGSRGCRFSQAAGDLEPMVAPAFRQRPGWKWQDHTWGRGMEPHGRSGLGGGARRRCAAGGRKAGRGRPPGEPARTKARRRPSARGGGEGAGADSCGPSFRPPGGLASLPPQPLAWLAAPTHRPGPCP